jgi:selenocysteine lyase/cysteine desulfurase
MDAAAFRSEFPVLERNAYLNAGTDGPVPAKALAAATEMLEKQTRDGRFKEHFEARGELADKLRAAYAALLGVEPDDIARTTSTTEGLNIVLSGLELGPGNEIVTSDEEHPGLIGALQAARDLRGVKIVEAPFAEVHEAIGPRTVAVATSHVSWIGGQLAPAELADVDVPVIYDAAQSLGAVPVDIKELRCDAYAAAGQKWMCGPDGTGALYVSPAFRERVAAASRGYMSFEDASKGFDSPLRAEAKRYEMTSLSLEGTAFALAAHDVLAGFGWDALFERSRTLAAKLADELRERGRDVWPRSETTLVAWHTEDDEAELARIMEAGITIRNLPGRGLLRASVGAWNDESDLERLLDAL